MLKTPDQTRCKDQKAETLVYRHRLWTRLTHWTWVLCLVFLLSSGLQIFNAHPVLYTGEQSGFSFDNKVLEISSEKSLEGLKGTLSVFDWRFDTTGVLGVSNLQERAFPGWATLPAGQNLAFARVIHFFFGWILVATLLVWLVASLPTGHLTRELLPTFKDLRALPRDVLNHIRFRFQHGRNYGVLQKLAYCGVMLVLLPLMIATGLAMSPAINTMAPWLTEILGGRQTARTLHFVSAFALVSFFALHIIMIFAAGPINEMRSILTGWYRIGAEHRDHSNDNT
jgi:thiosulfate reductase cytochrome b subunit